MAEKAPPKIKTATLRGAPAAPGGARVLSVKEVGIGGNLSPAAANLLPANVREYVVTYEVDEAAPPEEESRPSNRKPRQQRGPGVMNKTALLLGIGGRPYLGAPRGSRGPDRYAMLPGSRSGFKHLAPKDPTGALSWRKRSDGPLRSAFSGSRGAKRSGPAPALGGKA
jgi:hypothetical protein